MRSVWILHNPRAGLPIYAAWVERAAEALARRGVTVSLERGESIAALRGLARRAVAAGADAVLVAGGDGTLGGIAAELAESPVALGCLPAGTGNVFAQALGIPRPGLLAPHAFERAALLLADSPVCLADMGACNGRRFLVWASVGLDAFVVRQFELRREAARRAGGFLYNLALTLLMARRWSGADLRLRVSGPAGEREVAGHYLMVTVANIGLHGGGLFRLARDVRLDDGLMDVWAMGGRSYGEALAHAGRALVGRHLRHPAAARLTGERVDIYTALPQAFHLDAEPQAPVDRLSIQVMPRCLRVLVPARAARELFLSAEARASTTITG